MTSKKIWQPVKRLSLDELSMHKGHKHFKTVVGDIEQGYLLDVLNTHKQSEVIEALMQQPSHLREQVEQVSIDMWGEFPKVIEKVFPNATLVYDRFHVMQMVNKALNKLRKKSGITTKGSRTLLLTNAEDLLQKDQLQLQCLRAPQLLNL
ncbi:transposase [Chroococcidiopsis cubana]|nr:transposase [Chroococcidiopsis cubana]